MALVNGRRNQQQQILVGGAHALVQSIVANRHAIRMLANHLADGMRNRPVKVTKSKKGGGGGSTKQKSNHGPSPTMMYRSLGNPQDNRLRTSDRFVVSLSNTSANLCQTYLGFGMDNPTGDVVGTLFAYSNKLTAFKSLYRHYLVHGMKVSWVPATTQQATTGNVMFRIDNNPANEVNYSDVNRYLAASTHIMAPINECVSTVWRPREHREKVERTCQNSIVGAGPGLSADELRYGMVQFYLPNNMANATTLGYFLFEVDITFINPN